MVLSNSDIQGLVLSRIKELEAEVARLLIAKHELYYLAGEDRERVSDELAELDQKVIVLVSRVQAVKGFGLEEMSRMFWNDYTKDDQGVPSNADEATEVEAQAG